MHEPDQWHLEEANYPNGLGSHHQDARRIEATIFAVVLPRRNQGTNESFEGQKQKKEKKEEGESEERAKNQLRKLPSVVSTKVVQARYQVEGYDIYEQDLEKYNDKRKSERKVLLFAEDRAQ